MTNILSLFNAKNIEELSFSDMKLLEDLLKIKEKSKQNGGGYSIRPDLGEINGMVDYSGYTDKNPPVYIGELLKYVGNGL
jgi:hypothetical protein